MDEKVRERLRVSLEKNGALEDEMDGLREELNKHKAKLYKKGESVDDDDDKAGDGGGGGGDGQVDGKKLNGSAMLDPEVLELRRQIEKQATEAGVTHRNLSDLRSKNAELEEQLIQLNKELHQNQEIAKALEIDLKENVAQKGDQEERIATLEKR